MSARMHLLKYLKFNNVLKCAVELNQLVKATDPIERSKLLKEVKDCVIDAISEIAKNVLSGNIPLSEQDFTKLSKYQNLLRFIAKRSPVDKRRSQIIQNGTGIIDSLIPAALLLISILIQELID